jgi:hypothetical protein
VRIGPDCVSECSCSPSGQVESPYLRDLIIRLGLASVDNIRELDRVLNEKHRDVVSNNIPVTLLGVELDRKSANITNSIRRSTRSKYSRESEEDGGLTRCVGEDFGTSDIRSRFKEGELSKCAGASGMYDTFGDALVVEAVDL